MLCMSTDTPYSIAEYDESAIHDTLDEFPPLLRRLLANRGITDMDTATAFLDPDFETQTHDASLLKDIDTATERILKAVAEDQKTVIYSDYDTDGIPAAVILNDLFDRLGYEHFKSVIPHRNTRGFGVHKELIDECIDEGVELCITLDCGMGARKEIAHAEAEGMDTIVVDHHLPNGDAPEDAHAVVNPKQEDCQYPFDELCGAGIAYKLAEAVSKDVREHASLNFIAETPLGWERLQLLDMVGIATIADMVPLVGENRVLATYGLKVLRQSRRPGLRKLLETANVNQHNMDESDIGFGIGPLINAASRMDAPEDAFEILATRSRKRADDLAAHLQKINNKRKGKVSAITKAATKKLNDRASVGPVAVTGNPEWQPSLLGLAANNLVDTFQRPVFLWGRGGDESLRGSCRSDESINVVALMEAAPDGVLEKYGGHAYSGGFTIAEDQVHSLEDALHAAYETLETKTVSEEYNVDAPLDLSDISWELYDQIKQLAPFGQQNPQPLFLFADARVDAIEHFGKADNHLKVWFKDADRERIEAIEFFATSKAYPQLADAESVDVLAHLEKSTFGGSTTLRLRIVDIL
jgi:single-stranded-DNA-specific exonuclease